MIPVYFPFTYISESAVAPLTACFGQIFMYQPSRRGVPKPMQQWIENGVIRIGVPAEKDDEKIEGVFKDFMDWAVLHQGSETAFLASLGDAVPFFDKSSTAQLRSDIRKTLKAEKAGKETDAQKADPLFQARLFLRIAQEMDMQKSALVQDLLNLEAMEQNLYENLRGETAFPQMSRSEAIRFQADDPGSSMTRERIAAWAHLLQHDFLQTEPRDSGFFVTISRSVVDQLAEMAPVVQTALEVAIPVSENRTAELEGWRNRLMEHLEMLTKKIWPPATDATVEPFPIDVSGPKAALTIYIVPDVSPQDFFGRFVKPAPSSFPGQAKADRRKNTLIGLVQF